MYKFGFIVIVVILGVIFGIHRLIKQSIISSEYADIEALESLTPKES